MSVKKNPQKKNNQESKAKNKNIQEASVFSKHTSPTEKESAYENQETEVNERRYGTTVDT